MSKMASEAPWTADVQNYAALHNLSRESAEEMEKKCQALYDSVRGLSITQLREAVGLPDFTKGAKEAIMQSHAEQLMGF